MENARPSTEYKNAYAKGFSQAVRLLEYLYFKGVDQKEIVNHLNKMLDEDIRPWQTNPPQPGR